VTAATRLAEEKLAQKRENLETKSMGRAEAATRAHLRGVERQTKKDDDKLEKDAEKLEKAKKKAEKKTKADNRKFLAQEKRQLDAAKKQEKRRLEADTRGAPEPTDKKRKKRGPRRALLPPARLRLRSNHAPDLPLPALSPPRSLQSTRPMPTSAASPRCPLQNLEPFLSALTTRLPLHSLQSPISKLSPRLTGNPKRLASSFSPRLPASSSKPKSKVRKQLFSE
jgi:hypothetical protein